MDVGTVTAEMLRCVAVEISYHLDMSCGRSQIEIFLINLHFGVLFFNNVMVKKIYSEV